MDGLSRGTNSIEHIMLKAADWRLKSCWEKMFDSEKAKQKKRR